MQSTQCQANGRYCLPYNMCPGNTHLLKLFRFGLFESTLVTGSRTAYTCSDDKRANIVSRSPVSRLLEGRVNSLVASRPRPSNVSVGCVLCLQIKLSLIRYLTNIYGVHRQECVTDVQTCSSQPKRHHLPVLENARPPASCSGALTAKITIASHLTAGAALHFLQSRPFLLGHICG